MIPRRVHLLSLPHGGTTPAYSLCGFLSMTRRFAEILLRLGHEVMLYGSEENDAPCTTHVVCISKDEQAKFLGERPYQTAPFDLSEPMFVTFNARAGQQIAAHTKGATDILATIAGSASLPVHQQHPELLFWEYSIGYRGVCAPYRVYQSHAWRHVVQGFTGCDGDREFDSVIPPFYHVGDYPWNPPEDFVVFVGRIVGRKGIGTVCQAAERAGVPLFVMGFGDPRLITYGTYLGTVSDTVRNDYLSRARAVLMPTQYIEPFGNVAAEAQLCGTPVISTDYGGFTESVEHGVTGYRGHTLGEFVQAIRLAPHLDRAAIRRRARALYSLEAAADSYRTYFTQLDQLRGDGWHSLAPTLRLYGSARPLGRHDRAVESDVGGSDPWALPDSESAVERLALEADSARSAAAV